MILPKQKQRHYSPLQRLKLIRPTTELAFLKIPPNKTTNK